MDNIKFRSIKDIVDPNRGICYGIVQPGTSVDEGVPIIKVNNLVSGALSIDLVDKTSSEIEANYRRSRLQGGEILLSLVGSLGHTFRVPSEMIGWNVARAVGIIPVAESNDPNWVLWCLRSPDIQHKLKSLATTSVQATLNLKEVNGLEIPYPPAHIRSKIVDVLSTIESKIELNRQLNATLEKLVRALFQSWFVDFDPVRAKASGEPTDSICRRLGLTPELLALFPAELEESVMGEIPAGWKAANVGSLLTSAIGGDWGTDAPDEKHTEAARIIRGTDLPSLKSGNYFAPPARFVEAKKLASRKLKVGDLVLEVSGGSKDQPTGRALYISKPLLKELGGVAVPASFCRLLRPDSEAVGLFLAQHLYLLYDQGKTWLYQNQSTGISNFQTTSFLERHLVALPPTPLVKRFLKSTAPMLSADALLENVTLITLRDELLPKLLSGEMKLSTAN